MSSGMNRARAEEYAKTMTYKQAISNIRTGKGIMYRKATMIKLYELAEIADKLVQCNNCKWYQGVHGVQGHAPCELFNKQVLWNDFCSNEERSEVEE